MLEKQFKNEQLWLSVCFDKCYFLSTKYLFKSTFIFQNTYFVFAFESMKYIQKLEEAPCSFSVRMLLTKFHLQSKNWAITRLTLLLPRAKDYTAASRRAVPESIIKFGVFSERLSNRFPICFPHIARVNRFLKILVFIQLFMINLNWLKRPLFHVCLVILWLGRSSVTHLLQLHLFRCFLFLTSLLPCPVSFIKVCDSCH